MGLESKDLLAPQKIEVKNVGILWDFENFKRARGTRDSCAVGSWYPE